MANIRKIRFTVCVVSFFVLVVYLAMNKQRLSYNVQDTFFPLVTTTIKSIHHSALQKHISDDDDSVARQFTDKVRISCVVLSAPQYMETRAKYVVKTWGRRCTKLAIISSKPSTINNVVAIDVGEGKKYLADKALGAYRYAYKHHIDDADWFLMTDDDSYVIMENLRYFLSDQDTNQPVYFGEHFRGKFDFITGGAGIVLSKEAIRRFGKSGNDPKLCRQTGSGGDLAVGQCMTALGIKPKNSTDLFGNSRFHQLAPEKYSVLLPTWYHRVSVNKVRKGMEAVSDYVISFHYVGGSKMDVLEYLFYHTRLYGVVKGFKKVNQHKISPRL